MAELYHLLPCPLHTHYSHFLTFEYQLDKYLCSNYPSPQSSPIRPSPTHDGGGVEVTTEPLESTHGVPWVYGCPLTPRRAGMEGGTGGTLHRHISRPLQTNCLIRWIIRMLIDSF